MGEALTRTVNGVNAIFTLVASPSPAASLLSFLNGLLQRPGGNDFTLVGETITFVAPPETDSYLVAHDVE